MYSFAQHPHVIPLDEPFYAHFLRFGGYDHPMREEILATMENDGNTVVEYILDASHVKNVIFCKQMTHHLVNIALDFLHQGFHILLIRHPASMIASYQKVIPNITIDHIGIKNQWEFYNYLIDHKIEPIILDSRYLLDNPRLILEKICHWADISFTERMLTWLPGPKSYDGIWAKYWYESVHTTTCFKPEKEHQPHLPLSLLSLYDEALDYYNLLHPLSIRP